jgi:ABC-type nitrate/sulfonate/bicarbonate transport system ATPase subunit
MFADSRASTAATGTTVAQGLPLMETLWDLATDRFDGPQGVPRTEVEIRNVSKTFVSRSGRTEALHDIDLSVQQGEFLCLLGDSGCGKSTLLEIIAGFVEPTKGSVSVSGELVAGPSWKRGFVFQEPSLLPWLTVRQNISLGCDIRRMGRSGSESVGDLIALTGLTGFEQHKPSQISGGMAQRVAIARALANDAEVLLFDEPFSALDSFTRNRLQGELIRIWRREQFTAIFVTHDIEEAVVLATRVALMTPRPGRIAALFNLPLQYPRSTTSPEFFRVASMITQEFLALDRDEAGEATTKENRS